MTDLSELTIETCDKFDPRNGYTVSEQAHWEACLRVAAWNTHIYTTKAPELLPGAITLLHAARQKLQELGMHPVAIQVHEEFAIQCQQQYWKPRVEAW